MSSPALSGSPLSRRRLLIGAGLLGGLSATLVGLPLFWGHRPLDEGPPSPFLGPSARRTLGGVLFHLLPDGLAAEGVADAVDQALAEGDPALGDGLRLALEVLEHTAGIEHLEVERFSRQDPENQVLVLIEWSRSEIEHQRVIFHALRRLAAFAWWSGAERWPAIGYDGPWVNRPPPPVEALP